MPRKVTAPQEKTERKVKVRGNGQGTVRQVGKKWRWEMTVGYRSDGTRISRSGYAETKSKAEAAKSVALTDYSRGLIGAPERITVAAYAERWTRRQLEVSPRTAKRYGEELAYALEHIGLMRLQDMRPHHLKDLMVKLSQREMRRGSPMSARTQAHVLTRLRSLFREAVSDQIIYVNPIEAVKRVKAPRHESAGESLDFHEVARLHQVGTALYAAGMCRLWPAVFTAVSIGLRRGEVMGLTWDAVDLDRGLLRVKQARVMGLEGIETGDPKTVNSRRDVHLPPSLVTVLRNHRITQHEERSKAGQEWVSTGAVFATVWGDWTHPDNLKRALESVVLWSDPARLEEKVWKGVPRERRATLMATVREGEKLPSVSPHDLRHTYATLALRRGVPVEVVSKVSLGVKSVEELSKACPRAAFLIRPIR